jgi:hypothetical protein
MPSEMFLVILELGLPVLIVVEVHPSIHSDRNSVANLGVVLESILVRQHDTDTLAQGLYPVPVHIVKLNHLIRSAWMQLSLQLSTRGTRKSWVHLMVEHQTWRTFFVVLEVHHERLVREDRRAWESTRRLAHSIIPIEYQVELLLL